MAGRLPKPLGCAGCPLYGDGKGFSVADGAGTNGVLVVGEALGVNEAMDGLPFRPYAQAGSLLEKAFRQLGMTRSQFRLWNIVACRPPRDWLAGAEWEFGAIRHCRPYLDAEIARMRPRAILALGAVPLRELTGQEGEKRGIGYLRGYSLPLLQETRLGEVPCECIAGLEGLDPNCFLCGGTGRLETEIPVYGDIPVIGTYHPSFLRRGAPHLFGVLMHDIGRAVQIARTGLPPRRPTAYQPHPSLDDILAFEHRVYDNTGLWLTYDIETPDSAAMDEDERDEDQSPVLTQIQFSLGEGEGIVFKPEHYDVARRIMALSQNRKAGFNNWLFDDPKLKANGFKFGGHFPHDLMVMWHHMQPDLPANLQFVASFYGMDFPWKHLYGRDMGEYGCADVDAPQRILAGLPKSLKDRGIWEGYERRTYQLRPVLEDMERRGVPINDEKRVAFGEELKVAMAEENQAMQALVPDELKPVHPKGGYKREPKDTTGMVRRSFPQSDADQPVARVERWCRLDPFTPSPKQLIAYMRHRGHKVPKAFKTDKETTAAAELERLEKSTGDLLYRRVRVYRGIQTMKGTFVDGWKPGTDGRVHTQFTFRPATAQLSSRSPNIQNAPQHTSLAEKFQEVIEAPPGYKLVSFDYKSFHALTLGFLAEDPTYMRIARIDLHSFVTSQFLRLKPMEELFPMADAELTDYLGWVKKTHKHTRDYKIKRVILGWQYGRGYRAIFHAYREDFHGEAEAKKIVDTLEGGFPKAVQFRQRIVHEVAKPPCRLVSPFGFNRWFWDVLDYRPPQEGKRGRVVKRCGYCGEHHTNGEQAEEAIAYLPANVAFGMMREGALEMESRGYPTRYGLYNNIHDAWKFCVTDSLVEECLATIGPLMEAPCPVLKHPALAPEGLWCAVEAKVGRNEREMEVVKTAKTEVVHG